MHFYASLYVLLTDMSIINCIELNIFTVYTVPSTLGLGRSRKICIGWCSCSAGLVLNASYYQKSLVIWSYQTFCTSSYEWCCNAQQVKSSLIVIFDSYWHYFCIHFRWGSADDTKFGCDINRGYREHKLWFTYYDSAHGGKVGRRLLQWGVFNSLCLSGSWSNDTIWWTCSCDFGLGKMHASNLKKTWTIFISLHFRAFMIFI